MSSFVSYAHGNIWGVGASREEAEADAAGNGGEYIQALMTCPATGRLVAAVARFTGGHPIYPEDVHWALIGGDLADLTDAVTNDNEPG